MPREMVALERDLIDFDSFVCAARCHPRVNMNGLTRTWSWAFSSFFHGYATPFLNFTLQSIIN